VRVVVDRRSVGPPRGSAGPGRAPTWAPNVGPGGQARGGRSALRGVVDGDRSTLGVPPMLTQHALGEQPASCSPSSSCSLVTRPLETCVVRSPGRPVTGARSVTCARRISGLLPRAAHRPRPAAHSPNPRTQAPFRILNVLGERGRGRSVGAGRNCGGTNGQARRASGRSGCSRFRGSPTWGSNRGSGRPRGRSVGKALHGLDA
jgi:hypothetical protein